MQVFNSKENIGDLTKLSATSVRLAPSVLTVGGQQFSTGNLDCDLTTTGAGGLDTGSLANLTFYYVYAILNAGSVVLVASTSEVQPVGFSTRFKVGAFYTDSSGNVFRVFIFEQQNVLTFGGGANAGGTSVRCQNDYDGTPVCIGISNQSSGIYRVTMSSGIFAEIPEIVAASGDSNADYSASAISVTTTQFDLYMTVMNTLVEGNERCRFTIHKSGIDAVQPDWRQYK